MFWLAACGGDPQGLKENREIADEVENRKIRRISTVQVLEEAHRQGSTLRVALQRHWEEGVAGALAQNQLLAAAEICRLAHQAKRDSLTKAGLLAQVRRYRLVGPDSAATYPQETALLEAYRYTVQQGQSLPAPSVQRIGDTLLLYSAPITLAKSECLRCHGERRQTLREEDYQKLTIKYQLDSLTGFRQGQTVAAWSLLLRKQDLIRSLSVPKR